MATNIFTERLFRVLYKNSQLNFKSQMVENIYFFPDKPYINILSNTLDYYNNEKLNEHLIRSLSIATNK